MERLRIRIPRLNYACIVESCSGRTSDLLCVRCLNARVRKEMATTALPRQPEVRHSPALRGHLSC